MLMERLLQDLRSVNSVAAHARVREDHLEALSFLRNRGFTEHQRMYGLKLNVAEVELDRFGPLVNRLQAEGIQISTFAEERTRDARCTHKLIDLHNAALPNWPDPEAVPVPFKPAVYDQFARQVEREAGDAG